MNELRIGLIGNVDSGKSTLTGLLTTEFLDNGKGLLRNKISRYPHERESGRTSSISQNLKKINKKEYINFIDLAGHEKYLKTTILGIIGYYIDYNIITVAANDGITHMTKEHLLLTLTLKIPFIIVITKIDIAPNNIFIQTKKDIIDLINKYTSSKLNPLFIENLNKESFNLSKNYPLFSISCKTGANVDILKNFIYNLDFRKSWNKKKYKNLNCLFKIDESLNVKGVGVVIYGKLVKGNIYKNSSLYIGPIEGNWHKIIIKSFHNNFKEEVSSLIEGESGCISIKLNEKKKNINFKSIKKGIVLLENKDINSFYYFKANIFIISNNITTIAKNYQPIINCNKIVQVAKIINISPPIIRSGDKAVVNFKFLYRPEFIKKNDIFFIREGKTRGIGKIIEVYN